MHHSRWGLNIHYIGKEKVSVPHVPPFESDEIDVDHVTNLLAEEFVNEDFGRKTPAVWSRAGRPTRTISTPSASARWPRPRRFCLTFTRRNAEVLLASTDLEPQEGADAFLQRLRAPRAALGGRSLYVISRPSSVAYWSLPNLLDGDLALRFQKINSSGVANPNPLGAHFVGAQYLRSPLYGDGLHRGRRASPTSRTVATSAMSGARPGPR